MNKYIARLTEEWLQHGKIIIAVDFDDTISPWRLNDQGECDVIIDILVQARNVGAYIVVFTACATDRHLHILEYCKTKDLTVDSINRNPIDLPYGNQNKIYANIFIDDRAGLAESIDTLKESMYVVRAAKYGNSLTEQNVEF